MRKSTGILAGAALLLGAAGAAQAQTKASLATFLEPNHIITRFQHNEFAEAVRKASGGRINIEVFSGGALIPAAGTVQGVASGVAQIAVHAANYTPSMMPISNAVSDLGFEKPDSFILAFAFNDFIMNEKSAYDEWRRNGVIPGAGLSTPTYHYMCRDVLKSHADLKGKKTRTPGAGYARLTTAIGMTPVNLPASEIYTGLERGALDCICGDVTHLQSGSTIGALVKSVVMTNLPPSFTSAGLLYNVPFWKGLLPDDRRMLLNEGARAMVRLQIAYAKEEKEAFDWGKSKNIQLIAPDAETKKAVADWVSAGIGGAAQIAKDNYKIQDPESVFKMFRTYLDKWDKALAGVDRTNEAAVFAVVKTNLFDKVDVSKYGME